MDIAAEIKREAERTAEASYYSLLNPYLMPSQKEEVEMWFQLPSKVMVLAFQAIAVYQARTGFNWYVLLGIPLALNVSLAVATWFLYSEKLTRFLYLSILHQFVIYASGVLSFAYLAYEHHWIVGLVCAVGSVIGFLVLEVGILVFTLLARPYGMHPKFAFFKRNYGIDFPFDPENRTSRAASQS